MANSTPKLSTHIETREVVFDDAGFILSSDFEREAQESPLFAQMRKKFNRDHLAATADLDKVLTR